MDKQFSEQFSAFLLRAGNTIVYAIIGLAFGFYSVVFTSSEFSRIATQIEDNYITLLIGSIIGNGLIMFGLVRIGDIHTKLVSKFSNTDQIILILSRVTLFRIIVVFVNFLIYLTVISIFKFDNI